MKSQNKKNEELQSRRQFFRKAALGALPILGAVVLANVPLVSNATRSSATGCQIDACTATCKDTCRGTCRSCSAGCSRSCVSGCSKGASR